MGPLERLIARLSRMDGLRFHRDERGLTVPAADERGFEVAIERHRDGWVVRFGGWIEEFLHEEDAVECFAFGLTDACRLARWSRDGRALRWTVEARTDEGWVPGRSTGHLLFPLDGAAEVRRFRNAFVRMDGP